MKTQDMVMKPIDENKLKETCQLWIDAYKDHPQDYLKGWAGCAEEIIIVASIGKWWNPQQKTRWELIKEVFK
jgi:hypothetical protein